MGEAAKQLVQRVAEKRELVDKLRQIVISAVVFSEGPKYFDTWKKENWGQDYIDLEKEEYENNLKLFVRDNKEILTPENMDVFRKVMFSPKINGRKGQPKPVLVEKLIRDIKKIHLQYFRNEKGKKLEIQDFSYDPIEEEALAFMSIEEIKDDIEYNLIINPNLMQKYFTRHQKELSENHDELFRGIEDAAQKELYLFAHFNKGFIYEMLNDQYAKFLEVERTKETEVVAEPVPMPEPSKPQPTTTTDRWNSMDGTRFKFALAADIQVVMNNMIAAKKIDFAQIETINKRIGEKYGMTIKIGDSGVVVTPPEAEGMPARAVELRAERERQTWQMERNYGKTEEAGATTLAEQRASRQSQMMEEYEKREKMENYEWKNEEAKEQEREV